MLRLAFLGVLAVLVVPPQGPKPQAPEAAGDVAALMATLPRATVAPLDAPAALLHSALPLTCVDELQPRPSTQRPYFWQPTYRTVDAYEKTRAFYGCGDWPTAASATWTLVTLLKQQPPIGSGQLIREKLTAHLGRENLDGELAYFKASPTAQRPYGHAWFLKLFGALATWKDADAARYTEAATPLARFFADGLVAYSVDLERPNRAATQANTALTLNLLLDYVDDTKDMTIKRAVSDAARRLFANDAACPVSTEAATPEVVSPCLEEAALMSRVLEPAAYTGWLDKVLPAPTSTTFAPLLTIHFDATGARGRGGRGETAPAGRGETASAGRGDAAPSGRGDTAPAGRGAAPNTRANWIGLAFTRATAYLRIAAALPAADARVAVFRRLADIHAQAGQKEATTAAAFDAPWVGAFAVSHLMTRASLGGAR